MAHDPALPSQHGREAFRLAGLTGWLTSFEIVHVTLRCHSKGILAALSSRPPLFHRFLNALWECHLPCPWAQEKKKEQKKKTERKKKSSRRISRLVKQVFVQLLGFSADPLRSRCTRVVGLCCQYSSQFIWIAIDFVYNFNLLKDDDTCLLQVSSRLNYWTSLISVYCWMLVSQLWS